ncbi:MAG: VOC family protein [Thermoanaerobaculia bacterium]
MAKAKSSIPKGYQTITPAIVFEDTRKAIAWYEKALGAKQVSLSPGPDGKIMHAEVQIGNSLVMFHDEMMGAKSARTLGGTPVTLWAFVDDCDAVYNRAVAAGAKATMPLADMFWGDRGGTLTDPFGMTWWIATRKEDLTPEEMETRAQEFYKQMKQG